MNEAKLTVTSFLTELSYSFGNNLRNGKVLKLLASTCSKHSSPFVSKQSGLFRDINLNGVEDVPKLASIQLCRLYITSKLK